MGPDAPAVSLTIYLAKGKTPSDNDLIPSARQLGSQTIRLGEGINGRLYAQPRDPLAPSWASFFEGQADLKLFGLVSSSAAVLIVPLSGKAFALTFGMGRFLLDDTKFEERFGLRTTLNSVPANRVRSIDKATFDTLHRQTRTQANRTATPQEFGVDIEKDLIRAITGVPADSTLGSILSGHAPLRANVQVTLASLPGLLRQYLARFRSSDYRAAFPWIDNIAEVVDASLETRLNAQLVQQIQLKQWRDVQLTLPQIIDWASVAGFTYGRRGVNLRHSDLDIAEWAKEQPDLPDITIDKLSAKLVYCVDDEFQPLHSWPLRRCLYAELILNRESYVLSAGVWYQIARQFGQGVNRDLKSLAKHSPALPRCSARTEGEYNEQLANSDSSYLLMDRRLVSHGGSHSSIEFCDVFTKKGEMIHLKWYGSSAVLSHLFAQGAVSGELFASDEGFRVKLNQKLDGPFKLSDPSPRPDPKAYTIVFGVINCERDITELPFFSRVNLRSVAKRLLGIGYNVRYDLIPPATRTKLTKTARAAAHGKVKASKA